MLKPSVGHHELRFNNSGSNSLGGKVLKKEGRGRLGEGIPNSNLLRSVCMHVCVRVTGPVRQHCRPWRSMNLWRMKTKSWPDLSHSEPAEQEHLSQPREEFNFKSGTQQISQHQYCSPVHVNNLILNLFSSAPLDSAWCSCFISLGSLIGVFTLSFNFVLWNHV